MKPSEILKKIKIERTEAYGICHNFYVKTGFDLNLDLIMVKHGISYDQWEHFSGRYMYPVPAKDPKTAYLIFNKWSKRSKYGKMRWQLLDWLIEQFEAKGA